MEPAIPDASRFAYVNPIATADADELRRREAARKGRGWWWIKLPLEEGRAVVWMSTNLVSSASESLGPLTVALIDLHPRMAAWALTARWRAEELAQETVDNLGAWRVVTAATTARALLEGVLAFCGEAQTLEAAWSEMKASGPPEEEDVVDFRFLLDDPATQAQLARRHFPGEEPREDLKRFYYRKNVLSLIERGAKVAGLEQNLVDDLYGELTDTAHPSTGSDLAYVTEQEIDPSQAQIRWEIARGLGAVPVPPAGAKPEAAMAAARALCLSLEIFVVAWPRFIHMVDDFGLTTEVSFRTKLRYWRRHGRPSPNEPCPVRLGTQVEEVRARMGRTI